MTLFGIIAALGCSLCFVLGQMYGEKTERKWFVEFIEKNLEE